MRLPALGESAAEEFNLATERRVGEQVMREVRRDPDYLDDPVLLEYLQALWQPLVAAARARGDIGPELDGAFPFEAFLVRDRSVNAFALPGGYVGVHLGLMALTASADELASVLAHELSHVTQRHIARSVAAAQRSSTASLVATLLGVVLAARASSPDAAQAAIMGGQAAALQAQLNFSRDMEREADRNGWGVLVHAGFAPSGMVAMFEKLDQSNRLNDSGGFPYLRSHPLTTDRVGEAQQRVAAAPAAGPAPVPLMRHGLMQARARVLMDPSVASLRRLQDTQARGDAPARERGVALYTRALASLRLRDHAAAAQALSAAQPLQGDAQARAIWSQLRAEAAIAAADPALAAAALQALPADGSRATLLLRAQLAHVQRHEGALRDGVEALQTWVAEHRHDAQAWQLLGTGAELLGLHLRSLRAQAEAQAALGNTPGAIDRLRAGQQLARRGDPGTDFIEASVIDARLRELQAQQRRLAQEQSRGRTGDRRPDDDSGEPPR